MRRSLRDPSLALRMTLVTSVILNAVKNLVLRTLIELAPLLEFFEPEPRQRVHVGSARFFMAAGDSIVFVDQAGQPLGDRKAFVFAVGDRLQEARADILPIVLGDPAALGAEDALQNNCAVADIDRFVQGNIPSGGCVERIHHALHAVGRLFVQREPAAAHETAGEQCAPAQGLETVALPESAADAGLNLRLLLS